MDSNIPFPNSKRVVINLNRMMEKYEMPHRLECNDILNSYLKTRSKTKALAELANLTDDQKLRRVVVCSLNALEFALKNEE